MPDFRPVFSSWVSGIAYDPETNELHVQHTKDGSITTYADVPPEVFHQIDKSPSIGTALHGIVRGNYEHRTVRPDDGE